MQPTCIKIAVLVGIATVGWLWLTAMNGINFLLLKHISGCTECVDVGLYIVCVEECAFVVVVVGLVLGIGAVLNDYINER
jgi:hypothetical protein